MWVVCIVAIIAIIQFIYVFFIDQSQNAVNKRPLIPKSIILPKQNEVESIEEKRIYAINEIQRDVFPFVLNDYTGQKKAREILNINLFNKDFSPILYGPPGTGKSLLIELFTIERNRQLFRKGALARQGTFVRTEGKSLTLYKISEIMLQLRENDVLFIDEIHSIPGSLGEKIYSAIQEKIIYGVDPDKFLKNPDLKRMYYQNEAEGRIIDKGAMVDILLPESCVICGATTELGLIATPLYQRMYAIRLTKYSIPELEEILLGSYNYLVFDPEALRLVAENAQGIPRLGKKIINGINPRELEIFEIQDAEVALSFLEIKGGLMRNQRQYLKFLKEEAPCGKKSLADYLGVPTNEVEGIIEPYLKELGYIKVTSKGRELTKLGKRFV